MISNQVIQGAIDELYSITEVPISVYDNAGSRIVSTGRGSDTPVGDITSFAASDVDSESIGTMKLFRVEDDDETVYVVCVESTDSNRADMAGRFAASELHNLAVAYKERFDRNSFFQNLLLDNLLLVDIYNRAKKLHIEVSAPRAVYLVEIPSDHDTAAAELLRGMYSAQAGDYVTSVDESSVILIKMLPPDASAADMLQIAQTITDMMNSEIMENVRIAYGTVVSELKDVSKSYKEAKMALDVGQIFYADKNVVSYSTLGIGRLIYQLPINLCKLFIKEIFGDSLPDELDDEMLVTINKFFENNLNVSETSRQLYVHRNTLVYRIDKLERGTGLDIRKFEDALTFKIALMVVAYMRYLDNNEY